MNYNEQLLKRSYLKGLNLKMVKIEIWHKIPFSSLVEKKKKRGILSIKLIVKQIS